MWLSMLFAFDAGFMYIAKASDSDVENVDCLVDMLHPMLT
jgi:hypothetical protein